MKQIGILWALFLFYIRLLPRRWYARAPFLPVPPSDYVQWRLKTAYGQDRPGWGVMLHDLWQFGDWLRTFKG